MKKAKKLPQPRKKAAPKPATDFRPSAVCLKALKAVATMGNRGKA